MTATPQPAQPARRGTQDPAEYERFVDGALRDHVVGTGARPDAADIEPRQLLRYAAGKASEDERTALEDFVKRSRWAYDRVVTLVRLNRPGGAGLGNTVARKLLAGNTGRTHTVVGQAILEADGIKSKSLEDSWKTLEKDGTPRTRAACLLGLGRLKDARTLIDSNEASKEPAWTLLRRVCSAAMEANDSEVADDQALLALLDVLPSL